MFRYLLIETKIKIINFFYQINLFFKTRTNINLKLIKSKNLSSFKTMQETLAKTYVEWRACSNPCVKKASPPSPSLLFQCYLYGLKGKKRYIRLHILVQSRTHWPFFLACSKTIVCCPPKSITPSCIQFYLIQIPQTKFYLIQIHSLPNLII